MHFTSIAESFWGMKMSSVPRIPNYRIAHGITPLLSHSFSQEERICPFGNSDTPVHRFTEEMINPANIVYLPTPQNTYANVYHQQQIEKYGRHYHTDILLEEYYQQKELEELYEYIRWIEKNDMNETYADGWNMETFFRCVEWTEDNRLTEKESYAWADQKWSQMEETADLDLFHVEPDCLEKDIETFFHSAASDSSVNMHDIFQTTAHMHMDLYLEKMEELYRQKIEGHDDKEPTISELESFLDRETFGPEDGWGKLCDLV